MKSLFHLICGLLAVACFLACGYGIWKIWECKPTVVDKTTYAFAKADEWLGAADKAIEEVRGNLEASRAQIQVVHLTNSNSPSSKPNYMQTMLTRSVVSQVSPDISEMRRKVERVTEASIVVNSILESLHDIEPLEALNYHEVRSLQGQVEDVTQASWELNSLLAETSGVGGENSMEKSQRIANSLGNIINMSNDFQKKVQTLHNRVVATRDRTLYWMHLAPMLITIALGWVMVSQIVVLFSVARSLRQPA